MICGLKLNRRKLICDYHMHTPLCGHASGHPEEYANHALKMGLKEIGFSDHAPFVVKPLQGITMKMDELPLYHTMIEDVRARFKGRLEVRIGIEADFVPGYEKQTKTILDAYPYDYVIGSVHFIKDWGFDNPEERGKWNEHDVDGVYRDYFERGSLTSSRIRTSSKNSATGRPRISPGISNKPPKRSRKPA